MNMFELIDVEIDPSYTIEELDLMSRTGFGLMRAGARIAMREGPGSPAYLIIRAAEAMIADIIRSEADGLQMAELAHRLDAARKGWPERPAQRDGEAKADYDRRVRAWMAIWQPTGDDKADAGKPAEAQGCNDGGRAS